MMRINETEVQIKVFDKSHTCIVSGVYHPASPGSKFEQPESEEFELVLTTEDGRDISDILVFDVVFNEVVKQLKEMKDEQ